MTNDLIRRQDVIDLLEEWGGGFAYIEVETNGAIDAIYALPSAQPERKKGKWIRTRTMEHDGELYCDQCEQEHPEQKIIWNFCPNCGADMRGGDS